jgi:predicted transcriptional regulator
MGRQSLVAIGRKAFDVMRLYDSGLRSAEIKHKMGCKYQEIQCYRSSLIKAGWLESTGKGECKLTNAGRLMLNSIYANNKITREEK